MIEWEAKILAGLLLLLACPLIVYLMVQCVKWARTRSSGALVAGALMSVFAPDPTLERNIAVVEKAGRAENEEDREGEPQD
jgi:hypothetical protein